MLGTPGRGDNTTKHTKVKSLDVVQENKGCICGVYRRLMERCSGNGQLETDHGELPMLNKVVWEFRVIGI